MRQLTSSTPRSDDIVLQTYQSSRYVTYVFNSSFLYFCNLISAKIRKTDIIKVESCEILLTRFSKLKRTELSLYLKRTLLLFCSSHFSLSFPTFMESHCLRLLIMLIILPSSTFSATNCNFPAIFNFGDSNSDTGGLSAAFGQAPPPNGETFFHSPSGRYCDGRLLIDFIAERLGLPYLSAFLDSLGSNFSHGANFATAGSTIRPPNMTIAQSGTSPISLDVQLVQFSDFHRRTQILRKQGGMLEKVLPKEADFSGALYTFDIGQNDLTAGYKLNLSTEQVKAYVPDLLSQFSHVIKNIYAQGGRSFLVHNTGPVGCLPYVMDRFLITAAQVDKHGCASPYNDVAQYFNLRLKEAVTELRKDLPLAMITYVDVYSVKYSIISNAKKLRFEDPFLACCGHGGRYNYNRFMKCGTRMAKSCSDPSTRISWDGTHFTEAANKWIFDQIVDGSFSDPPTPLPLACHKRNV